VTILDALDDPNLFAGAFPVASWAPWRAFLGAVHGLPLEGEALALYRQCTGREVAPTTAAREAWAIVGRRGGKSRVAALLAVWTAVSRDWSPFLGPGERATVAVIAADRAQSRVVLRYINGLIDAVPMLARMVTRRTATSVELGRVVLEVHTCSYRSTRGYSFAAVVADEDHEPVDRPRHHRGRVRGGPDRRGVGVRGAIQERPRAIRQPRSAGRLYGARPARAPPVAGVGYVAFVDPSGGSSDSFTLGIAHAEERDGRLVAVLDAIRERLPSDGGPCAARGVGRPDSRGADSSLAELTTLVAVARVTPARGLR